MAKHKHTGKFPAVPGEIKAKKGKDKMAHSSHHGAHGAGKMHGFGPVFHPPEDHQPQGGGCPADDDNIAHED